MYCNIEKVHVFRDFAEFVTDQLADFLLLSSISRIASMIIENRAL